MCPTYQWLGHFKRTGHTYCPGKVFLTACGGPEETLPGSLSLLEAEAQGTNARGWDERGERDLSLDS